MLLPQPQRNHDEDEEPVGQNFFHMSPWPGSRRGSWPAEHVNGEEDDDGEEEEEDVGNTRNLKWKVAAPRSARYVHPRSTSKSESRVEMARNLARKMMMDTPKTWRYQRCRNGSQPEHGRISAAEMDKNRNEKHWELMDRNNNGNHTMDKNRNGNHRPETKKMMLQVEQVDAG